MRGKLRTVKNAVVHVVLLAVIFLAAVVLFERWINESLPLEAEEMASSTFPLVYIHDNGTNYNCLHGYAAKMDVNYIRDTLTVLNDDHQLDIQIQPFNMSVENVSYEVLTLDGSESLENTRVVSLKEENNYLNATLQIQNKMLMNQEYILQIQVTAGGRDIYFYTRLVLEDGLHLDEYLDFVAGFYEKCVNGTDESTLAAAVEPDETTDQRSSMASVNIHDSVARLMWQNLKPQVYYKPTPSLVDINGTTASFVLNYRISSVSDTGVTEIYNVKEFYRLRYTDSRVFLLDFTRNTEEVFDTNDDVISAKGINLGIASSDISYAMDPDKKIIAFVQENELWSYEINSGRMTRIFGFPQKENMDYRDFYDKNEIKILRVDAAGNVWFCVSGYMNRGTHEGENGVALYYYEQASSTVEEAAFLQSMESYARLKLDVDALAYITDNEDSFYILLEENIYQVNLNTKTYELVAEGIHNECYAGSDSNRHFAWLEEGERYNSSTLHRIDLETGLVQEITCGENERLRPVAFMGEDLVYGTAKTSDLDLSHEGNQLFPMYRLTIVNAAGEEVKTYQPDGVYVMKAEKTENMLLLTRAVKQGEAYTETTTDNIVSSDTKEEVEYGAATQKSTRKGGETILRVGQSLSDKKVQTVNAKLLTGGDGTSIAIPVNQKHEQLYYVYARGSLESIWTSAGEAIRRADEQVGVVVNDAKEFVWERGNKEDTAQIPVENIPVAFQSGSMDTAALTSALGKTAIDLTGCTLDEILYFVSNKRPVLAAADGGCVIITGYDDYGNLILLKPGETETYFYGPEDSQALFEAAGNQFVTYLTGMEN